MRIKFTKRLLFFTFTILAITQASYAALIRSNGSGGGGWNSIATWEDESGSPLGRIPQDGDEIIIEFGDIVSTPNFATISLDGVTIAVRGDLIIGFFGELEIDANSLLVIETGGTLTGLFSFVTAGGSTATITFFTPVPGPQYIDSTGVFQPGAPSDYIPLPIELISFNAKLSGSVVEIDWATATELNNDFFTIERSLDGVEWSIIGEPEGAGDSHVRLDYQFIDYNPMPGLSYYRLKQTDFDGQFEYFSPSVVLYEPANLFKVFPNPVADVLNLTTSSNLENAAIVIKNLNGQQEQVITTVNSHQAQMDVQNLPPGIYVLEIIFNESTLTKRILKK